MSWLPPVPMLSRRWHGARVRRSWSTHIRRVDCRARSSWAWPPCLPTFDSALLLLGDQPLVRLEVMEALVASRSGGGGDVIRPRYANSPDIPGHPVLLGREAWPLIAGLEGDAGLGVLLASGATGVTFMDVPGGNPGVDTPADLLSLKIPGHEPRVFRIARDHGHPRSGVGQASRPRVRGRVGAGSRSVRAVDPTHFEVLSGLGVGSVRVRFVLDVKVFDIVDRQSLKMRALGKAPGSVVEVVSSLRIADDEPGKVRLDWSATSELRGTIARVGPRLIEGIARRLTEEFWTDFARRVSAG